MQVMKIISFKIFLPLLLLAVGPTSFAAGADELISPYISLQYFKNTDNQTYIQTTLTYSSNRMELPLPGLTVTFMAGSEGKLFLADVVTNEKGVAKFQLDESLSIPFNEDGSRSFFTEFKGNDTIEPATLDISVIPLDLKMNLSLVDTIKSIELSGFALVNGDTIPAAGETVMMYVSRMFSLLPVGEAILGEDGKATIEFPSDLPGNSNGLITIIAKIEENPSYGNVERIITNNWGTPILNDPQTASHRALWTKTPPKWMIFTLSVLLAGVWGHYMFAIVSLILIRRNAKKKIKE